MTSVSLHRNASSCRAFAPNECHKNGKALAPLRKAQSENESERPLPKVVRQMPVPVSPIHEGQPPSAKADVSPRGDSAGFVQILDQHTLAITDCPGNNRLDTLVFMLANPSVKLLFITPGFDDTLRVNGQANLVTDSEILRSMRVNDRIPKLAMIVKVSEVFLHCAKAFRRFYLWDPHHLQNCKATLSFSNITQNQTTGAPSDDNKMGRIDDCSEVENRNSMY